MKKSKMYKSELLRKLNTTVPNSYDIALTYLNNGIVKIRKYKRPIVENSIVNHGIRKSSDDNGKIAYSSLTRTRKIIIETIMCNEDKFISFITLTFAENITDPKTAYAYLRKFLRRITDSMKSEGKEFYYLFVPEVQKRGAIHFHGITNIELGSSIVPRRKKLKIKSKGKYRILEYYNLPFWTETIKRKDKDNSDWESLGYSSAVAIKKEFEDFNIGIYLTKYLTKDLDDIFFGHQKILKSKNLEKPKKYTFQSYKDSDKAIVDSFENLNKENITGKFMQDKELNDKVFFEFVESTYNIPEFDLDSFHEEVMEIKLKKNSHNNKKHE